MCRHLLSVVHAHMHPCVGIHSTCMCTCKKAYFSFCFLSADTVNIYCRCTVCRGNYTVCLDCYECFDACTSVCIHAHLLFNFSIIFGPYVGLEVYVDEWVWGWGSG